MHEKMQEYAKDHEVSVRELLKITVSRWLNEGLFVSEHSPMCNSDRKETCNDADTKLPHRKIFQKWLKVKNETKAMVQKLMDDGQLKVESRVDDLLGVRKTVKLIIGESLYNLEGNFIFAQDFKKQADSLKHLGWLIAFLRKQEFLKEYASLLRFAEIYKKLSVIYEIDLGYKIDKLINNFKESVEHLNNEICYIAYKLEGAIHQRHASKFLIEIFTNDMLIHLDEIEPGTGETEEHYYDEFKKVLGEEFERS